MSTQYQISKEDKYGYSDEILFIGELASPLVKKQHAILQNDKSVFKTTKIKEIYSVPTGWQVETTSGSTYFILQI